MTGADEPRSFPSVLFLSVFGFTGAFAAGHLATPAANGYT